MTDFYIAAASIVSREEADEHPLKTIVLFSCAGSIASLCLMTFGIDLGAGWI